MPCTEENQEKGPCLAFRASHDICIDARLCVKGERPRIKGEKNSAQAPANGNESEIFHDLMASPWSINGRGDAHQPSSLQFWFQNMTITHDPKGIEEAKLTRFGSRASQPKRHGAIGSHSDVHLHFAGGQPPSLIEDEETTFEASVPRACKDPHRKMLKARISEKLAYGSPP